MPMTTNDPRRLDGKVAIVAGATGGIGEATAKLFFDLGAKVMLVRAEAKPSFAETCGRLGGNEDVRDRDR